MYRFQILAIAALLSCASSRPPYRQVEASARYGNTVDVGDVEEETMATAFLRFSQLAAQGKKEITLRIDSFGGSIFLGNRWAKSVEDVKKAQGIRVTCIVDGAAYSMAAVILESPVCDLRLATARSTILFHNGSGGVRGTAEDMKRAAAFLEALNFAMGLAVATRIGMPFAEYLAKVAHTDWTMAVPEALAANVIDGIASPEEIDPPALPLGVPGVEL